jgi:hypothetical protein
MLEMVRRKWLHAVHDANPHVLVHRPLDLFNQQES